MSWQDPRLWAAIISVDGIGRRIFYQLLDAIKSQGLSAEEFWKTGHTLSFWSHHSSVLRSFRYWQRQHTLNSYQELLQTKGVQVVTRLDARYPSLLAQIPDAPPILFVKGPQLSQDLWGKLPVAVVGTRHPTQYGKLATEKITTELSQSGATIVSGCMVGIDLEAHQAALTVNGKTLGVLGFGFDHIYPAHLRSFFADFLAAGQVLVSEYPPHTKPTKGTFPQRNRIVAGLSWATVVVEAGEKSGSLITAGLATEYGREVYAVPGPYNSIYSQGTVGLLNQGAQIITSGYQVVRDLVPVTGVEYLGNAVHDELAKTICSHLQKRPHTEAELANTCQKPLNHILATLSMMEVAGWLQRTQGRWSLTAMTC